jgi:hypothetical protein
MKTLARLRRTHCSPKLRKSIAESESERCDEYIAKQSDVSKRVLYKTLVWQPGKCRVEATESGETRIVISD